MFSGHPNNGNWGAWLQRFDASGNKVGEDIHLDSAHGVEDVEIIPGVGFAVVWKDVTDPQAPTYGAISASRSLTSS